MKKHNLALVVLMALGITACNNGGGSSNSNAKPESVKKPENKLVQTKEAEVTKPAENKSSDNSSAETKKAEGTNPVENKPTETKTPEQSNPIDKKPAETKAPEQANPIENKPTDKIKEPEMAKPNPKIENLDSNNIFANDKNYKGSGFEYPRGKGEINIVGRISNSNDMNFLRVDNNDIEIFPKELTTNSLNIKSKDLTKLAHRNQNTLWAIIDNKSYDHLYVIVNGVNPTKNIDSLKGNIQYEGSGYHGYKEGKIHTLTDSSVQMTANFDEKTLTGKIQSVHKEKEFSDLEFGANIKGNSFQGRMNNVEIEGGFFGENAKEAIARYENIKEQSFGVFGVKKK